jgi:hypothetical protein
LMASPAGLHVVEDVVVETVQKVLQGFVCTACLLRRALYNTCRGRGKVRKRPSASPPRNQVLKNR